MNTSTIKEGGKGEEKCFTHIDLFSGIGGFSLAAQWVGFKTIAFCEINPYCQVLLSKRFNAKILTNTTWKGLDRQSSTPKRFTQLYNQPIIIPDIRQFPGRAFAGATVFTGGFPCQPFSVAGKRLGKADERYLWEEMFRVIKEARPSWIIGENVTGIISMALDEVISDLESEDYSVQTFIIPACAVNTPHRRDRVWILAYDLSKNTKIENISIPEIKIKSPNWNQNWTEVATRLCGVDDGLPTRVDGFELSKARHRMERIKALGEAIVPQVAYVFFMIIKFLEEEVCKNGN